MLHQIFLKCCVQAARTGSAAVYGVDFPLVMVRAGREFAPIGLRPARFHLSLSVNPSLMIAQDAFRTRLALLQCVVPFDVAGVRQLLAITIR